MGDKQKKAPSLEAPSGAKDKEKEEEDNSVLDSWENEALSSSDDEPENNTASGTGKHSSTSPITSTSSARTNTGSGNNTPSDIANSPAYGLRAPPSTPHTHAVGSNSNSGWSTPDRPGRGVSAGTASSANTSAADTRKRPEKQTAVANRLIAGALGVRSHRSEEEKAYDRAIRDNERRRIAREREEEATRRLEAERAKQAMWEK